jgi:hypothetical protein
MYNMSFTRFHDDPVRIEKRLDISTFEGRYQLNRPGPGLDMPFYEDPNQRLQFWGANLHNNTINLESDLKGLTRPLTRDDVDHNNFKTHAVQTYPMRSYGTAQPYVEESRATHPAWMFRDLEQSKWETPLLNPQVNLERPFLANVQTRILRRNGVSS